MNPLPLTPSQTVGPFFAYGLTARQYGYDYTSLLDAHLTCPDTDRGDHIVLTGRIFDGEGRAVNDALVELWQAGPDGQYPAGPLQYPPPPGAFRGYGRLGTGPSADHRFTFTTVKPGAPRPGEAPHVNVILLLRGSLRTLYTRLYFSDEPEANAGDALLNAVPAARRETLLAQATGPGQYRFDVYLQGPNETVFFEL
jgi:protocatechuate 3,4-dioxygenase alpha subunit